MVVVAVADAVTGMGCCGNTVGDVTTTVVSFYTPPSNAITPSFRRSSPTRPAHHVFPKGVGLRSAFCYPSVLPLG
jgi:hypothetical protein